MLIAASVILALVLVITGGLIVLSPGKARPLVDESGKPLEGSISEKIRVEINGVKQGMFIKSRNDANPVLLFVQGGPGLPEYFMNDAIPPALKTTSPFASGGSGGRAWRSVPRSRRTQ
jgi:hypothetical protein